MSVYAFNVSNLVRMYVCVCVCSRACVRACVRKKNIKTEICRELKQFK